MVSLPGPFLILFGGVCAFLTWRGLRRGEMVYRTTVLRRLEQPLVFNLVLWTQAVLAALAVALGLGLTLGPLH